MTIDEILALVPDKFEHKTTTSKKFKRDVYSFFDKPEFKNKTALEIGSNLGYTTFILSFLFKQVYGINEKEFDKADEFCKRNSRNNVKFFGQDVYKYGLPVDTADVIMVDALHTYPRCSSRCTCSAPTLVGVSSVSVPVVITSVPPPGMASRAFTARLMII